MCQTFVKQWKYDNHDHQWDCCQNHCSLLRVWTALCASRCLIVIYWVVNLYKFQEIAALSEDQSSHRLFVKYLNSDKQAPSKQHSLSLGINFFAIQIHTKIVYNMNIKYRVMTVQQATAFQLLQ